MTKTIEEQVIEFCVRETGTRNKKITEDATLLGDLGIYGDDADEFFELFAEEFNVDLSGLDLWWIRSLFLRGNHEKIAKKKTIRVKDLIETVKNGKWKNASE